ncbi:hypothetical protein QPK13_23910, partial [Photorhabdus tasmaniensis]
MSHRPPVNCLCRQVAGSIVFKFHHCIRVGGANKLAGGVIVIFRDRDQLTLFIFFLPDFLPGQVVFRGVAP